MMEKRAAGRRFGYSIWFFDSVLLVASRQSFNVYHASRLVFAVVYR
jgi:hypothetical protein